MMPENELTIGQQKQEAARHAMREFGGIPEGIRQELEEPSIDDTEELPANEKIEAIYQKLAQFFLPDVPDPDTLGRKALWCQTQRCLRVRRVRRHW